MSHIQGSHDNLSKNVETLRLENQRLQKKLTQVLAEHGASRETVGTVGGAMRRSQSEE